MNLKALVNRFTSDEDGAVTVDWVVLAAGCVGLAIVIGTTVGGAVDTSAGNIAAQLTTNAAAPN